MCKMSSRAVSSFILMVLGFPLLYSVLAEAADSWTVASVLGGHSMKLTRGDASQLVVLHGVVAPKLETEDGAVARQFLKELALGQHVRIGIVRESRRINYVTAMLDDGTDLASVLLTYGLVGWDKTLAPDLTAYADLEAKAKESKLGIWGDKGSLPEGEGQSYVLRSDADGTREAFVSENGTTVLRMKGDEVPNYEVRARASQEKYRRAEQRAQLLAEQERQRADALRERQAAEAQAQAQARQDYLYHLQSEEQRLHNDALYLNNQYWRQRLYGSFYTTPYWYPYPYNYTYSYSYTPYGYHSYSQRHTQSPFFNVYVAPLEADNDSP